MKHYALALVNKVTGEIDHMSTSQAPMVDDRVGHPEDHATTHQIIRFEFEADPDIEGSLMRARSALGEFEMVGNNPASQSAPNAIVRSKAGRNRASNIITGRKDKV